MTAVERLAEKAKSATGDTLVIVEHGGSSDRILARSLHLAADCIAFVRELDPRVVGPDPAVVMSYPQGVTRLASVHITNEAWATLADRIKEADGTAPSP